MSGIYGNNKKGLNIQVTDSQYDFLYDLVMSAYDLDIPKKGGICKLSIILLTMFVTQSKHI